MSIVHAPLNLMVAGIYWSGSGAVVDYFKGHPDCCVPRGEFTDFKRQGRIGSILEASSSAQAKWLCRFMWLETALGKLPASLLKERDDNKASWTPEKTPLKEMAKHHRLKLMYLRRYRQHLKAGGKPSDSTIWQQWLEAVGAECAPSKKAIVWNQPIWVGKHEQTWPDVFTPFKLLVVHRDPIDQFAEVVRQGKIGKRKSDPAFDGTEKDDIAYVLKGIASKMERLIELQQQLGSDRVMTVNFESFVKDTDAEAERACQFAGLEAKQLPNAPFNPGYSISNIGIGNSDSVRAMLADYQPLVDRLYELRATFNTTASSVQATTDL